VYFVAKKFASYACDLKGSRKRRENRSRKGKNGLAPGFNQWFRRQPGVSVKKMHKLFLTTKIRIVIPSTVVPLSNASSIPLPTSCRCTQPLCCISRFLSPTHVVLSCTPFLLFVSFFRTMSLRRPADHPGAECDTRRSLVNAEKRQRKSCIGRSKTFMCAIEAARIRLTVSYDKFMRSMEILQLFKDF